MAKFDSWRDDYEDSMPEEAKENTDYTEDNDEEIDFDKQYIKTKIMDDGTEPLSNDAWLTIAQCLKDKEALEQKETFEQVFTSNEPPIKGEDITFSVETTPEQAEKTHQREMAVGGQLVEVEETMKEAAQQIKDVSSSAPKIRTYNKTAVMPKRAYAKANTEVSPLAKLGFFLLACVGVGIFFGVEANSYYNYKDGAVKNALSCAFSWIFEEDMPIDMSPMYSDIFGTGFLMGAGILGIIGLFIYLDNDAKKASRVGHEHGKTHLVKSSDHKIYVNRFME